MENKLLKQKGIMRKHLRNSMIALGASVLIMLIVHVSFNVKISPLEKIILAGILINIISTALHLLDVNLTIKNNKIKAKQMFIRKPLDEQ